MLDMHIPLNFNLRLWLSIGVVNYLLTTGMQSMSHFSSVRLLWGYNVISTCSNNLIMRHKEESCRIAALLLPTATAAAVVAAGAAVVATTAVTNTGVGIAGLFDENRVFLPMQLTITCWEDGTDGDREPRDGDVKGEYTLNLTRAGNFSVGQAVTVYKFVMARGRRTDDVITSGSVLSNVTSAQAVDDLCTMAEDACRSYTFQVDVKGRQVVAAAEQWLGHIRANSVVFFLAVRVDRAAASAVGLASG
jgi:hypothetical protein